METAGSAHPANTPATSLSPGDMSACRAPSDRWRSLSASSRQPKLPEGLDAWWHAATGRIAAMRHRTSALLRRAQRIVSMESDYATMSDARLRQRLDEMRERCARGRESATEVDHAFAMIREAAARTLGMKPYPVQVACGLAIRGGCVAEMATGEGKTLAATAPAVIAGWRGRGCHVLTVNDYLAQRDAEEMGPVYRYCGLSVAFITQDMPPDARRAAYQAGVTYCTNKEVAADFLRDRLTLGTRRNLALALLSRHRGLDGLLMRGLHFAIVDEADSILIDEAVTPLILSGDGPNLEQAEACRQAARLAPDFAAGAHYTLDHRHREVRLTPGGAERAAQWCAALGGVWSGRRRREELIVQALTAREFFLPGKHYVVQQGKVVIVDEFTGRLMPDRTWRDGLHQAVEAKEQLEVQPLKVTLARISFQRFFRGYRHLGGMTGTAWEARRELWRIYRAPVAVIPTHRPCQRRQRPGETFVTAKDKWAAIVEEVRSTHALGRPVLIGARSVAASEHLSGLLTEAGLPHQVLNAVRHAEEARIVAGAGQARQITVATNMAGRGTDIKLGRGVAELGGLHVIATERHASGRVDRQLFGRAGRQGDPGSAVAFASLEDELVRTHAGAMAASLLRRTGRNGRVWRRLAASVLHLAQRRAESAARRQRHHVLRSDDWLAESLGFAGEE